MKKDFKDLTPYQKLRLAKKWAKAQEIKWEQAKNRDLKRYLNK